MRVESLRTIFQSLQDAGVRYLVVGGLAVVAHGYGRFTDDVDLVIDFEERNLAAGLGVLSTVGYRPRLPVSFADFTKSSNRELWKREKNMVAFPLVHSDRSFPGIDVFSEMPFDFETEFSKSLPHHLSPEVKVPVVSLETLIEMKKAAGRNRDLDDIDELRKINGMKPLS